MEDYYYYYSYSYSSPEPNIPLIVISAILAIVSIVAMWRIFTKAGKPGWASIIPIYNIYVLFEITWGQGIKFLLLLIPIADIVFMVMTYAKLSRAFGKSTGFTVGLIFLGPIFMLILAFGNARYLGVPDAYAQQGYQTQRSYSPQHNYQAQQGYQAQQAYRAPQSYRTPQGYQTQQAYQEPLGYQTQQVYQEPQGYRVPPAARTSFCPNCGTAVAPGTTICQVCGTRL